MQKRIDYIPICEHGSVLITARNKREALRFVYENEVVTVPPMNDDEAIRLFENKLGKADPDSIPLINALDGIPLAITQAAAYIRDRQPRCSVHQYLRQIECNRGSRRNPLQQETPLPNRDAQAVNSVLLTWHISFEHLQETRRSAAELLSLMSFCERHDIPETLIRAECDDDDATPADFEDDIIALRNFSFVTANAWEGGFAMHGLVQHATQIWLQDYARLDEVRDRFVHCLYLSLPPGRFENWPVCKTLYPHAKCASEQRPADRETLLEWAAVMYNAAWYAVEQGMFADALAMSLPSFEVLAHELGRAHDSTLWSAAMVALAYWHRGQWEKAEALELGILEERRTVLGAEHSDTLTAMANLASTYWMQHRSAEAEDLELRVLAARHAAGLDQHPATLISMANLASTYWRLNQCEAAAILEEDVLATRRRVLGPMHPDTLTTMNNLAATYWKAARCAEAEALYVLVLDARKEELGSRHPDTLTSMNNLASTLLGRPGEAEKLLREVVEARREVLGIRHPGTLGSMADLALVCSRQERWVEAEDLQVRVLRGLEEDLGPRHDDTLAARERLEEFRRARPREVVLEILETPGEVRRSGAEEERGSACRTENEKISGVEGQKRKKKKGKPKWLGVLRAGRVRG